MKYCIKNPVIIFLIPSLLLFSCKVSNYSLRKNISDIVIESPVFKNNFTGLVLFDPEAQKAIYSYNSDKYFNPASNTKLFTFYTALNILGDSIPALEYMIKGDSLIFKGTGDPSFLNGELENNPKIYRFFKDTDKHLFYSPQYFSEQRYGPGWAWDDFNDYYATEKAAFPIYGNVVRFHFSEDSSAPEVIPSYFSWSLFENKNDSSTSRSTSLIQREEYENTFHYSLPVDARKTKIVPFKYTQELFVRLLSDTISKPVQILEHPVVFENAQTIYSIPSDSVYKKMLQESDNFMAEQMLMLCAGVISDTLESNIAIDYMKKNYLQDLDYEPHWVDGSGLSRYNLFTPHSIVNLLEKILEMVPRERLFSLLSAGGRSGNLKGYFKSPQPFVYAKTGTLSNNYCLSGYLLTKSGKLLIFSFMNNNYIIPEAVIKNEVEQVIRNIHEHY